MVWLVGDKRRNSGNTRCYFFWPYTLATYVGVSLQTFSEIWKSPNQIDYESKEVNFIFHSQANLLKAKLEIYVHENSLLSSQS